MTIKKHISENIKRLRTAKGLSQWQLSMLVGITDTEICNIENGKKTPSVDDCYRYAKSLGCHIMDILPTMKEYNTPDPEPTHMPITDEIHALEYLISITKSEIIRDIALQRIKTIRTLENS